MFGAGQFGKTPWVKILDSVSIVSSFWLWLICPRLSTASSCIVSRLSLRGSPAKKEKSLIIHRKGIYTLTECMFILNTLIRFFTARETILFSAKCHYGLDSMRILFILLELESSYKCCVCLDYIYCNFNYNGIECFGRNMFLWSWLYWILLLSFSSKSLSPHKCCYTKP